MTLSYPLQAFDNARPIRHARRSWPARDKLTSIAITVAIHVLIGAMALTAVHVARPRVMQELSVQITPRKIEVAKDMAPPPRMTAPTAIAVPPPVIQTVTPPPPVTVQQAATNPVPPQPVAAPQKAAGETRDSYLGRVLAQLNRFKQYPRAARAAHIEGVVMLHFVMDAQGRVQSFEIAKSSGRPVLDAEALALIQRAQPLPALPADFPSPTLDAVVPIEFSLGG
jgi:protein TonB